SLTLAVLGFCLFGCCEDGGRPQLRKEKDVAARGSRRHCHRFDLGIFPAQKIPGKLTSIKCVIAWN
ncbi:mCG146139, partial [Mus musculus]